VFIRQSTGVVWIITDSPTQVPQKVLGHGFPLRRAAGDVFWIFLALCAAHRANSQFKGYRLVLARVWGAEWVIVVHG